MAKAACVFALLPFCGAWDSRAFPLAAKQERQAKLESNFLKTPTADGAEAHLRYITSKPHIAGMEGDFEMAEYVRSQMEAFGLRSYIENVSVFLNYPSAPPSLDLLKQVEQVSIALSAEETVIYMPDGSAWSSTPINLAEPALSGDSTSDTIWRNHTFLGYAPSGEAEGELVYANYGTPQDFEVLRNAGVDVAGKIVLVRYGECFRGLKVRNAQESGALAVLIYSDPFDDGFVQGPVYPEGPWRPEYGVQRGSVQFNSLCGGDPKRAAGPHSVEELCGYHADELIPKIPAVPLSYGSATQLLQQLGGKAGPADFKGGLSVNYTMGPSGFRLHLRTQHFEKTTPIPNVVTVIEGLDAEGGSATIRPVLLGNHRDAWVFGAADPNSGTASLLELGRGLGALVKGGWKPLRTIMLLSWSGEEYGLLGSTAWAELHEDIVSKSVAYLNVDVAVQGSSFNAGGTFALRDLLIAAAASVPVPGGNGTLVLDRPWHPIGSGSDYTVFLDHFGVASMDFSFERRGSKNDVAQYGQYHSIYDSFDWMAKFGGGGQGSGKPNTSFQNMRAMAQVWGLVAMRLADDVFLAFNHTAQAEALEAWRSELAQEVGRALDTTSLQASIASYGSAADKVAKEVSDTLLGKVRGQRNSGDLNDRLAFTERQFTAKGGLPDRKWYKHLLQAPGIDLGYEAQVYPGVRDMILRKDLANAQIQLELVAARIIAAARFLEGAVSSEAAFVV